MVARRKKNLPAILLDIPRQDELLPYIPDESAQAITRLARAQVRLEDEIAKLEQQVAEKRDKLRQVQEDLLPSCFETAGSIRSMTLAEGWEIEITEFVAVNITEEKKPLAHAWLRAHNHGSLIKRTITVAFGKGEEQRAQALINTLTGRKIPFKVKDGVHPSTLKAFVTESIVAGRALPETIDVHKLPKSIIRRPKDGD